MRLEVYYEDNKQVLNVDEDKPFGVCPLLFNEKDKKFPALCYCSERFAERMFSIVYESPINVPSFHLSNEEIIECLQNKTYPLK